MESCCPAASPCCSSSFSSPSSPLCSENCFCSCSATASESGCGPWQLLGGQGHIRATGRPSLPQNPSSNLSQQPWKNLLLLNSLPVIPTLPTSHQSDGSGSPITFHVECHQPPARSPGQGDGTGTVPRQVFHRESLPAGFPFASAVCHCADPCCGQAQRGLRLFLQPVDTPGDAAAQREDTGKG